MPEGDAVFLTAHRLHKALAGHTVTRFELRVPALALADKHGRAVLQVTPRGKHLLMRFDDDTTLHSHLRLDGSWRVVPARSGSAGAPAHQIRALIGTVETLATGIRVHDLALLPTREENTWVGHLGPDLLAEEPDLAEGVRRLATASDTPIGVALLDQRLVAGLGTIWRSEVLWLNQLNPFRPEAAPDVLSKVITDAARLLRDSVDRQLGRRSRDPFRAQEGRLEAYGRAGRPCRRCGTPIAAGQQGQDPATERIVYYCPHCQGGPADG